MASNAAMLLDPRAYKKQLQSNGNDSESLSEPSHFHETSDLDPSSDHISSLSPSDTPPSPEDTTIPGIGSSTHSHVETGQQDRGDSARSASGVAPAGTVPTAHHLLDPKRRQRSTTSVPKPSPRGSSSRSSSVVSGDSSVQSLSKPGSDMDVEFMTTPLENGVDAKRDFGHVNNHAEGSRRNFIEDMYGVERRGNQPYKKLKTDHEGEKTTPAKSANFVPGDTGLGEYMKEGLESQTSPAVVAPGIVDLTAGMRVHGEGV